LRKQEKTVIAILGMHRSGTSLAGQMVHALGVPMGDNLIVANEYNERGYFEDSVVVKIHDELLMALGRPWQSISSTMPLPAEWMQRPETALAREKLRAHISAELRQGTWAVKDPRMARLLPLWKELASEVGFELIPLLCVRSPNEVASSLATRDHFPLNMGELLWTIYNFEIIDALGSSMGCVLCYEDWFKRPTESLNRLAAAIKVNLTDKRCQELASTIVDSKLRHHATKEGEETGPNAEFYRLLRQWANNDKAPEELATLLTIIRDSGALFAPWYEARETSYMAEAEEARIAEQARITASAEEYLKAYQQTEKARVSALEALKRVEQERDAVAAQAKDNLKAYQETEQARIAIAAQAEENLKAYQQTEQARVSALEALTRVEEERDTVAAQAKDNLKAYQDTERARIAIAAQAEENLKAYQQTEQARQAALHAIKQVEQERDAVAAQAREYLGAYQVTEQARVSALEAIKRVEHERDAATALAQTYHDAYQESERKRLSTLCHRLYRLVTLSGLRK
jgi:hypothetical protein